MKGEGLHLGNRGLVVASIVFILIVGAIFFSISGGLFGGNKAPTDVKSVVDKGADRSVRMTVEGPITAEEKRESYSIEVSANSREIDAMTGYENTIVNSAQFTNNSSAYTEFTYALRLAGFDKTRTVSAAAADERGVCATGKHYIFEVLSSGNTVSRTWTTSCTGSQGTLNANVATLKSLFDNQIVDRSSALKPISLR